MARRADSLRSRRAVTTTGTPSIPRQIWQEGIKKEMKS
jgi:hypothetical protein